MSECTDAEREFLDAMAASPRADPEEMVTKLAISRLPAELIKRLISARAGFIRASQEENAAWSAANDRGVCGKSVAFKTFYDFVNRQAEERLGK